ncbi:MAG: methylaspartate ammonia-lyase, partial [Clostridia bacterium]|nr:methylaspartate ammonia-lyase [Clostridia bacterium]
MKIKDVILTKSYTGFYFDDQKAIKQGAGHDGFMYLGEAVTEGFTAIRQAGEAISIQLILEDGSVALGDCAAVQYSGAGGRDPLFIAEEFIPFLEKHIVPELIGQDVSKFRPLAEKIDTMVVEGKRLHTAIRYGLSQAILNATATARRITMAEVIRDEYDVEGDVYDPIPVFTQSGDDRHDNADKMIIKQADVLPHALINNVETKLGKNGEILLEYIAWLRDRILKYRTREDYSPVFHMDVYGTIGLAFNYDVDKMFNYLLKCEETAKPFRIRIEGPIDTGDREGTLKYEKILTSMLNEAGSKLEIVADEWCNT